MLSWCLITSYLNNERTNQGVFKILDAELNLIKIIVWVIEDLKAHLRKTII